MQSILFLSTAPQHSLWCLGLAAGPFRDAHCVLAHVHSQADRRDYVFEALGAGPQNLFAELRSYPRLVGSALDRLGAGRRILDSLSEYTRQLDPRYIFIGNDRRIEFYAALRGAPRSIGVYLDDGWGTYRGIDASVTGLPRRMRDWFKRKLQRFTLGVEPEMPLLVGGSHAVREAWVMAPEMVNRELASKTLRQLEPAWFRDPGILNVCADAVRLSGMNPAHIGDVDLLLVLPHDRFLVKYPALRSALDEMVRESIGRGGRVAYKFHPRSRINGLHLPPAHCTEVPQRLPVEILAPFLSGAQVAGIMTSALIFLPRLQPAIQVRALVPADAMNHPVTRIYREMDTPILEIAA